MVDPILKCRYTQARLTAFIHNELPVNARRYVARHIDECPACHASYEAQKTLKQNLLREMPRIGQPEAPALSRMWTRIEAEMLPQSASSARLAAPVQRIFKYKWAYVCVAMVIMLMSALPLALLSGPVRAAVPQDQPPPQTQIAAKTHTPTMNFGLLPTTIAQVVETEPGATHTPDILQNTPAAPDAAR